jgi:hypothetical protein
VAVALAPADAASQVLRCDVTSKFKSAESGCDKVTAGMWNIVDFPRQTISRCDSKGCDTYNAQFATSGAYINIALPANGMLARLSSNGTMFMETATLTGMTASRYGPATDLFIAGGRKAGTPDGAMTYSTGGMRSAAGA